MIRLFASDLDGTLLTDHVVDDIVLNAIRQIRDSGREFAVVTGREMFARQRRDMGLEPLGIYTICMNGARILSPDGEELFCQALDKDFLRQALCRFPLLMTECLTPDRIYIRQSEQAYVDYVRRDPSRNNARFLASFLERASFSVPTEQILQADVIKLNIRTADPALIAAFQDFLQANRDAAVNQPFREDLPGLFEITDPGTGKAQAVAWLLAHLGLTEEQAAVYGDGPNDREMLRRFPHSFAPQNASPSAKAAAGTVIGDCADHAVPEHMCRLLAEPTA